MNTYERPFACEPYEQHFTTFANLKRRERRTHGKHGGSRTFNCPHQIRDRHAGKGFSRNEHLKKHLRSVHGEKGTKRRRDSLQRGDGERLGPLGEVKRPKREAEQTIRPTNTRRGLTIDQLCS